MKLPTAVTELIVLLIVIKLFPVTSINCLSPRDINEANMRCLTTNGIDFQLPLDIIEEDFTRQMQEAVSFSDPEVICTNLAAYRDSLVCLTRNSRKCVVCWDRDRSAYLPSEHQMVASQDYLCHNRHEYNATCVNAVNEDILECSRTKVGALIRKAEFTQHQHMCMSVELALGCVRELTDKCGSRTQTIYLHFNQLQYPSKCGASSITTTVLRGLLVVAWSISLVK